MDTIISAISTGVARKFTKKRLSQLNFLVLNNNKPLFSTCQSDIQQIRFRRSPGSSIFCLFIFSDFKELIDI